MNKKLEAKIDDLIKQATEERSHYYVKSVLEEIKEEIDRDYIKKEELTIVGTYNSKPTEDDPLVRPCDIFLQDAKEKDEKEFREILKKTEEIDRDYVKKEDVPQFIVDNLEEQVEMSSNLHLHSREIEILGKDKKKETIILNSNDSDFKIEMHVTTKLRKKDHE